MKKWMALLLCCLLCLCTAGAMAEEKGTLNLNNCYVYRIYPDGYFMGQQKYGDVFRPIGAFQDYTGLYTVTGESEKAESCLDFHAEPHKKPSSEGKVEYTVVFRDVRIEAFDWATTLRFGDGEDSNDKEIILNLINYGNSYVSGPLNHPLFANAGDNQVTINIHNTPGSVLELNGPHCLAGKQDDPGKLTSVFVKGNTNLANLNAKIINDYFCEADVMMEQLTVAPTCTTDGNTHYWECAVCGSCFEDKDAQKSTTRDDVTVSALGHDLEKVPAKDPTCTEKGNIEHYRCTRCGSLLNDANGSKELTADGVTVSALGHDLEKVPAKDPTYEQEGNIEYYRCTRCGKLFSDANGTQELTANDVVRAKLVRTDTLPQTGDSSSLLRWTALLGACCAGLLCLNRRRG